VTDTTPPYLPGELEWQRGPWHCANSRWNWCGINTLLGIDLNHSAVQATVEKNEHPDPVPLETLWVHVPEALPQDCLITHFEKLSCLSR